MNDLQEMKLQEKKIKRLAALSASLSEIFENHQFIYIFCLANLLNMMVEMFSRRNFFEGIKYLFFHPLYFEYNVLIILSTLALALLFKRRSFAVSLVSFLWLALGMVNCILLSFRVTPLGGIDFMLLSSVWSILFVYLNLWQIGAIVMTTAVVIAAGVLVYKRSRKRKVNYSRALAFTVSIVAVVVVCGSISTKAAAEAGGFANLAEAYEDYGFAFCFSTGIVDVGIGKPEEYSPENIEEIRETFESRSGDIAKEQPNIIFLQLESFFDPEYLMNVGFSETPTPNFKKLKKDYPNGFLSVPSIGAGTANTEFEVLTGMNIEYFGVCEYPYKTILSEKTCESLPYILKNFGYSSRAIHNHSGSFYDRNQVYENLGFEAFTSIEYMQDVEKTEFGWAKDKILTGEILKALAKTQGNDFIYTISVQAHGKYPDEQMGSRNIEVSGIDNEKIRNGFEYYVNQIHEVDEFLGELVSELEKWEEPTVLVMYGDHLPSFDITDEDLSNGDVFQTEYVIWNNIGIDKKKCDLQAYQLSAKVLEYLGMDGGVITRLHQKEMQSEDYQEKLEILEYDMLYGDCEIFGGKSPYKKTEIKMGTDEIKIIGFKYKFGKLCVFGENFTEWSKISINSKVQDTQFISSKEIETEAQKVEELSVLQISDDKKELSEVIFK